MGGKAASPPPAPDYTPLIQQSQASADASFKIAQMQQQTSREQLDWAKQQYNDQAGQTSRYVNAMVTQMNAQDTMAWHQQALADQQAAQAQSDRQRYEQLYQPLENQLVDQAQTWNSPARAGEQAAQAMADVNSNFNQARTAALSNLESYGIDPSQTRFGALDLGTRIQQAAASAAAGTQSRLQTQATGLALQSEAINIGRGYPGQVAQSYATANQSAAGANQSFAGAAGSGGAGINAGLNTASTYGNLMGTGATWAGLGNQSMGVGLSGLSGAIGGMNTGFQNQLGSAQYSANVAGNQAAGIGSMVGGALAIGGIAAVAI